MKNINMNNYKGLFERTVRELSIQQLRDIISKMGKDYQRSTVSIDKFCLREQINMLVELLELRTKTGKS